MEPVLCALDFSENTASVLQVAIGLSARFNSRLIILYAYRIIPQNNSVTDYRKTTVQRAHDNFDKLANQLQLNGAVPYEFRAEIGFLSDRIESCLKAEPVQLIVMSEKTAFHINEHKGLSLKHFINQVATPVLIVPESRVLV